jgi:CheY-like chemotaxis protein/Tfp pilus assembly protein PilZ
MDKILIVDDVKLLREMQKGILSSSRVEILTAGDGQEALDIARKELPSMIIMDNHMPVMDGVTCCRELKADPLLKHIPVIMLTNAVRPADVEIYRDAGASDCLAKPIDSKLFLATIKKILPSIECRGIRVPLCTEVRLHGKGCLHTATTKDISQKGVFVSSEFQPSPGEEIQFAFVLPGSTSPTEVRGKVAWARNIKADGSSGGKAEFGVEFLEITGSGIPFLRKSELEAFVSLHAGAVSPPGVN